MISRYADADNIRTPHPRSGFVLVMVLALIAIIAFSTAGFARHSLALTQSVADAREDLQSRWGTWSCRRVLLKSAREGLLKLGQTATGTSLPWPQPARGTGEITLGGLNIAFDVADEDAKINLNALLQQGTQEKQRARIILRRFTGPGGLFPRASFPRTDNRPAGEPSLQSWSQVFEYREGENPQDLPGQLQVATREITCWGSGRLNLIRATDEAVREYLTGALGQPGIGRLLRLRRSENLRNLEDLLRRCELDPTELQLLKQRTTDLSKCHSLWLTVRSPRREWTSFTVDPGGQGSYSQFQVFSW